MKANISSFVVNNPDLYQFELTAADWLIVEQTIEFLEPFKAATKRCEGDYVTLDKVQQYMDSLDNHLRLQQERYKHQPAMLGSVFIYWHAFNKYYQLTDTTGAYTTAILLHPALRKAYLQAAWKRDWITAGVARARALWLQYKEEEEELVVNTAEMDHFQRWKASIAAKSRASKSGQQDEFERFINAPQDDVDISPLQWWLQPQQQRS